MMGIFIIIYSLMEALKVFGLALSATIIISGISKKTDYLRILVYNLLIIVLYQLYFIRQVASEPSSNSISQQGNQLFIFLSFTFYTVLPFSLLLHKHMTKDKQRKQESDISKPIDIDEIEIKKEDLYYPESGMNL